jgi:uncharacterized membrane protein
MGEITKHDRSGRILSGRRIGICAGAGVAAALVTIVAGVPELAGLVGWIVAAGLAVGWVWRISWPQGQDLTEQLAEEEGGSRSTDAAVLLAAVASLGAIVLALVRSSQDRDATGVAAVVLAVVAAVASWALVNTVFALKYARLYYFDIDDGGLDFKQDQPPAYSDFAYYAFTVGMSFAPPEVEVTSTRVRKVALGHALLSYAFGTVVLAVAINLVTNLGQS